MRRLRYRFPQGIQVKLALQAKGLARLWPDDCSEREAFRGHRRGRRQRRGWHVRRLGWRGGRAASPCERQRPDEDVCVGEAAKPMASVCPERPQIVLHVLYLPISVPSDQFGFRKPSGRRRGGPGDENAIAQARKRTRRPVRVDCIYGLNATEAEHGAFEWPLRPLTSRTCPRVSPPLA